MASQSSILGSDELPPVVPTSDEKTLALVCHIVTFVSAFIAPLIIYFLKKDESSFVTSHAKESLNFQITVLLLVISKDDSVDRQALTVLLSITGMIFSWVMVHTIFTFHYAHLYYDLGKNDTPGRAGLEFPAEKKPDYIDFAYFAFVIGMTFQVSDVEINSRQIRRTALAHGLLAFALNTFVVALTINLIGNLK